MTKSQAQIRRNEKRAEKRGETYTPPPPKPAPKPTPKPELTSNSNPNPNSKHDQQKANIVKVLLETLSKIETNEQGLNSKEKRSSKRKAGVIALEEVNAITVDEDSDDNRDDDNENNEKNGDTKEENAKVTNVEDLLTWYKDYQAKLIQSNLDAYHKYKRTLSSIENNQDLNSKDRRSANRKADAIACEESQFTTTEELCNWYKSNPQFHKTKKTSDGDGENNNDKQKKAPYILFIGQIPFHTTHDDIYQHFQKYIGKSKINKESMVIRIPHDKKRTQIMKEKYNQQQKNKPKKEMEEELELGAEEDYEFDYEIEQRQKTTTTDEPKSMCQGYAFAEFQDPELMYECFKLHHTTIHNRRINVIRAAGGGKEAKAEKHKIRRLEQDNYISETVDKIISDAIQKGDLQDGELDEGAVSLCKRRSAAIVELALEEYIEQKKDRDLENPSSFFSKVICDVTEEGIAGTQVFRKKRKMGDNGGGRGRGGDRGRGRGGGREGGNKKRRADGDGGMKLENSSLLAKSGVDMSISEDTNTISKIFPSMRGRGRGRGAYM